MGQWLNGNSMYNANILDTDMSCMDQWPSVNIISIYDIILQRELQKCGFYGFLEFYSGEQPVINEKVNIYL